MNNLAGNTSPSVLIQPGQQYAVGDPAGNDLPVSCQCTQIAQRNWSRVGTGQITGADDHREPVFLKQNVNKRGDLLLNHWEYEKLGTTVATELFDNIAVIPRLRFHNPSLALCVFEYIDVIPFDALLRRDNKQFATCFTAFLERATTILQALQIESSTTLAENLPVKERPYGGPSSSINFKGFDIRNIGIKNPDNRTACSNEFIMFDFGRPYRAPIEEAAAKLFISIGLLNWGRPMQRFARGPDTDLLTLALPHMKQFLASEAIDAELDLQTRFRSSEVHGSGILERSLKKLGIDVLGKQYLAKLRRWCTNHISA